MFLFIPPFLNYAALNQEFSQLKPVVILDAPTGMSSDVWALLVPELSKVTKVCVYDRAGLGFSERPYGNASHAGGHKWRDYTVERMADDLHRLATHSSQQNRPFVLVGAELGGLVARFYAQLFDGDVSDLVMIEPLVEDFLNGPDNARTHHWFSALVSRYQSMQLSAAAGVTRLALLLGRLEQPIKTEHLPDMSEKRQKYLMCNPRHLSTVVDEHHFLNESLSQIQTLHRLKPFPSNISVTVINGDVYDQALPSDINQKWAQAQRHLRTQLFPKASHVTVPGADRQLIYRKTRQLHSQLMQVIKTRRTLTVTTGTTGARPS